MSKPKITIGLLNGNEKITMLGNTNDEAKMAYDIIADQNFEEAVEIELHDDSGRVIESKAVKPQTVS